MKVKLLETISEPGNGNLKAAMRPGKRPVAFIEGEVIDMSEASGKKYIDKGWAVAVDEVLEPEKIVVGA